MGEILDEQVFISKLEERISFLEKRVDLLERENKSEKIKRRIRRRAN
jgi:chaperonin cofactor prefoldin